MDTLNNDDARLVTAAGKVYAKDARLIEWTLNRSEAFRFANWRAALSAIDTACTKVDGWCDPYLAAAYGISHVSTEAAARAFVQNIRR